MGFGNDSFRFLLSAQHLGFEGKQICTLGRQVGGMSRDIFDDLCEVYGNGIAQYPDKALCFADDLLSPAGFIVDSMDASAYEGASIIHDLNLPIPADLRGRYDLVWDGGTLEHVFNFPAALQNAMQMVRVGGHIFLDTPANNQCGHGFYQFSPELFFRVFTPANGFELLRLYIQSDDGIFHVVDPLEIHGRVELRNSEGTIMRVHAKKIADLPLSSVQQSDYVESWEQRNPPQDGKVKAILRKYLAADQIKKISRTLSRIRMRRNIARWKRDSKLSNRSLYIPVTDWNVSSKAQILDYRNHL
jgi:SAM-dependent methyltransferase